MNLEKQIIDQRLTKIVEDHESWFGSNISQVQKKEHAYISLGLSSFLNIELEEAVSHLCDGSQDGGIDALYVGEVDNDEFTVCILQSKYSENLEKDKGFPKNELVKIADTISCFFDPNKEVSFNEKVTFRMAEVRSLIQEGCIPYVKVICLNNGKVWEQDGTDFIKENLSSDQIKVHYINHSDILKSLQAIKKIDATLQLQGISLVEDFDFKRVLVGKVAITEIADLIEQYGDLLLEKNIRRFLGVHKNHVNSKIRKTLVNDEQRKNFYFYNNGITMLCKQLRYSALQKQDQKIKLSDLQIINGGQTAKTIHSVIYPKDPLELIDGMLELAISGKEKDYSDAHVMVRIYELAEEDATAQELTTNITIATNSQSPVDLKDLRANDELQRNLALQVKDLGYTYITKRSSVSSSHSLTIPSSVAAEAVFAIWKKKPNAARFRRTELFGKYYEDVFGELNSAQLILAVLIYRYCDARRKQLNPFEALHVSYSTHFLAMYLGWKLLEQAEVPHYKSIDHNNFLELRSKFEEIRERLYQEGVEKISSLLPNHLPPGGEKDLRKLSAIFRRGDLIEELV